MTPEAFEKGATRRTSSGIHPTTAQGVSKGRVLVCSNFHWLCDRSHWMGGTFGIWDNQRLLLNFVAGAIADRIGVWRGDLD